MSDFASGVDLLEESVRDACAPHDEWPARVAAGVQAVVSFFVEHPGTARTLVSDSPAAGLDPQYGSTLERFSDLLATEAPASRGPGGGTEQAVVGGIASVIATHVRSGRLEMLESQAAELVFLALLPYLGFEGANRWAEAISTSN